MGLFILLVVAQLGTYTVLELYLYRFLYITKEIAKEIRNYRPDTLYAQ